MKRWMKKISLVLAVMLMVLPMGMLTAHADDLWSEDYYRVMDLSESLSEAEITDLDEMCIGIMKEHQLDLAMLALTPDYHRDATFEELARSHYEDCGYGYGAGHDGFLMICDPQTKEEELFAFGAAEGRLTGEDVEFITSSAIEYGEQYGVYGIMYATGRHLNTLLETRSGQGSEAGAAAAAGAENSGSTDSALSLFGGDNAGAAGAETDTNARVGEGGSLPAWYPVSPASFSFYHDETAARVVDDADIFTDEEEAQMESRLAEIRTETGKDIVVYTDKSCYGMEHNILAADFFDFNGYGIGDEYEGACLFISMDPEDRGFYTACHGSDTIGLYTEEYANQMDDVLYNYMVDGQYGAGVQDWIENFRNLCLKGMPFAPAWYPERGQTLTRTHNPDAPRIDDSAHLLSDQEVAQLTEQAARISDKYGVDVAIHTAYTPGNLDRDTYAKMFYDYSGLGFGDNYDGIALTVFRREGYSSSNRIYASGKGLDNLSDVNYKRLTDFVEKKVDDRDYYGALSGYLSRVEHMERTGRVQRPMLSWILTALGSVIGGSAFGGVSLSGAKKRMAVPKAQTNADHYLMPGSLKIAAVGDTLLGTSTTRRYIPPAPKRTSGGGSSGGSTFHGSFSGSSGRTHSGSGRKF